MSFDFGIISLVLHGVCASWQTIAIYCFSPLAPVLVSFLFFFSFFSLFFFFFFFAFRNRCCCRSSARLSVQPSALWPDNKPIPVFALVASCPSNCRSNKCLDALVRARFLKMCPFHFQSRLGRCCTAVWERRSGGNSAAPRLSIIMYISLSTGVTCDLFYRSLWLFLTLSNRCSLFISLPLPFFIILIAMIRISNASGSNLKFNRSPEPDPDCGCALAQILK